MTATRAIPLELLQREQPLLCPPLPASVPSSTSGSAGTTSRAPSPPSSLAAPPSTSASRATTFKASFLPPRCPLEASIYGEHAYQATVAHFSPNGEWIASADVSDTIRIWGRHGDCVLKNEFRVLSDRRHPGLFSWPAFLVVAACPATCRHHRLPPPSRCLPTNARSPWVDMGKQSKDR